jgi:predicted N-acetyltransferase YhbS
MTDPNVEYLSDDLVDDALDRAIRGLLTTCFTKPQDVVFKTRRYFVAPYPHRWVIRDAHGALVAHVGVHAKVAKVGDRTYRVGGIAEVCVHPDYRGRGYVRSMLEAVHEWLTERDYVFAVLFGDPQVYSSSGYVPVGNLVCDGKDGKPSPVQGMIRPLAGIEWPDEEVYLPGLKF